MNLGQWGLPSGGRQIKWFPTCSSISAVIEFVDSRYLNVPSGVTMQKLSSPSISIACLLVGTRILLIFVGMASPLDTSYLTSELSAPLWELISITFRGLVDTGRIVVCATAIPPIPLI